uniref:hypothetical protein n=1 Tax=Ningiella ruwaisensis TaxID=2364274 RepID=UPI0010A09F67|nr:hypothetical protein [Ningiella ruwaisensis]
MKKILLIAAIAISGCQSTGNMFTNMCQIKEEIDTFTNQVRVDFTKCWVAAGESVWDMPIHKFGFTWYEAHPERIRVNLTYDSTVDAGGYTNFESLLINIDGNIKERVEFGRTILGDSGYNSVSNTIYTDSSAGAFIDIETFEQMLRSDDVRLRVNTSDGYSDYVFHISELGMTKYAKYDLPNYLMTINKHR